MSPIERRRARVLGIATAIGALAACSMPTDQSSAVHVRLDLPPLYVGDTVLLRAQLTDASDRILPAVDNVRFTVEPAGAAFVTPDNQLIALEPGPLTLVTHAVEYGAVLRTPVTVLGGTQIDSLNPASGIVRVGEVLQVHGVGLEGAIPRAGNRIVTTRTYTRDIPTSANGPGVLSFYIPALNPAINTLEIIGVHGNVTYPAGLTLLQYDVYEPNDTVPAPLPFQVDTVGNFFRPSLALESGVVPVDWYYFDNPVAQDVTISVAPSLVTPLTSQIDVLVADELAYVGGTIRPTGSWWIDNGAPSCAPPSALPSEPATDGFAHTIALRALPPGRYHIVVYAEESRLTLRGYQLAITANYQSTLAPDVDEGDDACGMAARLNLPVVGRSLTIDAPNEPDWYRVTLTNAATLRARVTATDPASGLSLRGFAPGGSTPLFAFDSAGTANLSAGTYYLLVTAARATAYTLDLDASAP